MNLVMEGSPLNLPPGSTTIFPLALFGGIDLPIEAILVQSCRADAERCGDTPYVEWARLCRMGFGDRQVVTKTPQQTFAHA